MRLAPLLVLGALLGASCGGEPGATAPAPLTAPTPPRPEPSTTLSPEEVRQRGAEHTRVVVPPAGTLKADVDAVFGTPRVITEFRPKGSRSALPLHSYEILPPERKQEFRVILVVKYDGEEVRYAHLNHVCFTSGRAGLPGDGELQRAQRAEIHAEMCRALEDLVEIRERYAARLAAAPWNRPPAPPADGR